MTILRETITVARPIEEAFAYVADFSTAREWDSTAFRSLRLTDAPIGQGSRFRVVCKLPCGSLPLTYELTEYAENKLIVLRGTCPFFQVDDTITFTRQGQGTHIEYVAEFRFGPLLKRFSEHFEVGLQRMGKASVAGLKYALEDQLEPPDLSIAQPTFPLAYILGRFSRRGFLREEMDFGPMSADLTDKHIVITGASGGIGYAAAEELAYRGANLTLVMRDTERANAAVDQLVTTTGNPNVVCERADLSSLTDVDQLANRLLSSHQPLDVLINNAGALYGEFRETEDNIEQSLALLLVSPYRLTTALKPLLQKAKGRVVNVLSGGLYSQALNIDRLHEKSSADYNGAKAYARAKRALLCLGRYWAQEWADDGITVNAMHPGWVDTPGLRKSLPGFARLTSGILRTPAQGADTIIWLAISSELDEISGEFFLDRRAQPLHLLKRTRDNQDNMQQLLHFLSPWESPDNHPKASASSAE